MLARLLRFIGISEQSASFVDYLGRILVWLGILGGGGMTALSIYTSRLYEDYGWAAVAAGALIGALVLAIAARFAAGAYKSFRQGQLFRALARDAGAFNPKLDNYSDNAFKIQDMIPNPMSHRLDGRTFHNCDFIGPGVIMFSGNMTIHAGGSMFFECGDIIFPPTGTRLTSALVLHNCTLRNCRFYRVGIITSHEEALRVLMRAGFRDPRVPREEPAEGEEPAQAEGNASNND